MAEKDEQVKLVGMWASPFSRRIEMALKLKGVQYEYVEEDLSNKSPLLLELNPVHQKIPVLVHDGKPIAESLIILEYIDETWKNRPLLPQDPYQRALARFWARFVDEKMLPTGLISLAKAEKGIEVAIQETQDLMKFLEKELNGKEFFGGETVGFLDIVAASMIPFCLKRAWDGIEIEVIVEEKFAEICRWIKRFSEIETLKECIPPREEHVQHMTRHVERIKSTTLQTTK